MKYKKYVAAALAATTMAGLVSVSSPVDAGDRGRARLFEVTVEIRNRAPQDGTSQTPFWVGVHDGDFDLYDRGEPLADPLNSDAMERLVEDGNNDPMVQRFAEIGNGADTNVPGPDGPIAPRQTARQTFLVAAEPGQASYFSYASMVLPSNDAFVANGDPRAHLVIDERGRFRNTRIRVRGSDVLDGGTEVNTEGPNDTAFLNQTGPDVGIVEDGVVELHPGFNAPQKDPFVNILGTPRFSRGDFTNPGYRVVDIKVTGKRVRTTSAKAVLTGDAQVPPNESSARGTASLRLTPSGEISASVLARDIDNLLFAHIHLGAPGENGPVVAFLFNGDPSENGRLQVQTKLGDEDLLGPLEGMTTVDLWAEILAGNAYVNVHSEDFPAGELRGDLR